MTKSNGPNPYVNSVVNIIQTGPVVAQRKIAHVPWVVSPTGKSLAPPVLFAKYDNPTARLGGIILGKASCGNLMHAMAEYAHQRKRELTCALKNYHIAGNDVDACRPCRPRERRQYHHNKQRATRPGCIFFNAGR